MDIFVEGLLSVDGQCQVAKDAPNFCPEWVSFSVFTLIPLERTSFQILQGFVIGGYFGTGSFECCWAMPSGQRCSKLLLLMGFNGGFYFDFPIESTGS